MHGRLSCVYDVSGLQLGFIWRLNRTFPRHLAAGIPLGYVRSLTHSQTHGTRWNSELSMRVAYLGAYSEVYTDIMSNKTHFRLVKRNVDFVSLKVLEKPMMHL